MTTTGDKSESKIGITWKRFESGNVLTVNFWRSVTFGERKLSFSSNMTNIGLGKIHFCNNSFSGFELRNEQSLTYTH